MDNRYVDILLIVFCIIGFIIGIFIVQIGIFVYNLIFFILVIAIIFLLVYKYPYKQSII